MFFLDCLPPVALPITWAVCEGMFVPPVNGDYEFGVSTTGRAKLFVDGELLIDNWTTQQESKPFFGMGTSEARARSNLTAPGHLGGGILRVGARRVASDTDLIAEAAQVASKADITILCLGLDKEMKSEGFDRTDMSLPDEQNVLASAVLEANPQTIVMNFSGSPVEMPWASKASTILQAWFSGSELCNGLADILVGKVNPSAKLPVSFPNSLKHNPSYGNFPGENGVIRYSEGLLVGYRHYTTREVPTLFPFGYGLSYTTFTYTWSMK